MKNMGFGPEILVLTQFNHFVMVSGNNVPIFIIFFTVNENFEIDPHSAK